MCGHVGIAGELRYDEEKIFKKLLLFDYFRGMESTGMAAIRRSGEAVIAKVADNPLILQDTNRFKNALNYNLSSVFMGHNRAATKGAICNANAHPFQFDHITGTHNGTLTTASTKALESELGETFSVDSAAMFAAIAKLGIEKTIALCETGTTSYDGAWSLVWYDNIRGTLNFLRNKWRPMWFAYSEDHKRLFWASEWQTIRAAIEIGDDNPQKLAPDDEGYTYFPTDQDFIYTFDVHSIRDGKKRPKPKVQKLAGKEPKPIVSTWTPAKGDPFERRGTTGMGFHTPDGSTDNSHTTRDVIHLLGDNDNPLAGTIRKADFEQIAKHGCSWCGVDVDFEDQGICIFERDHAVLCKECAGDIDVTRVYGTPQLINILSNV